MIQNKADIVIVDTQPKGAYDIGHIKGAINFPWAQETKDPKKFPKNKLLVLYCDCGHEEDSALDSIPKVGQQHSQGCNKTFDLP